MKPAICFLCGELAVDEPQNNKGDWVRFSNFQEESSLAVDHPAGLEYLCGQHLYAAKRLVHENSDTGLLKLEEKYGRFDHKKEIRGIANPQNLWSRISKVFKKMS